MREEYRAIVDAGFLLQIDDPRLVTYWILEPSQSLAECRAWCRARVEALNHALRGIPEDRVRFHTCYGINMGPRVHDMELKDVVDIILSIRAGAYSFEAANPRHEHEWRVWKDVKLPDDKILIPGVITQSSMLVEHPELVADRIDGSPAWWDASASSPAATAASRPSRARWRSIRASCGPSSPRSPRAHASRPAASGGVREPAASSGRLLDDRPSSPTRSVAPRRAGQVELAAITNRRTRHRSVVLLAGSRLRERRALLRDCRGGAGFSRAPARRGFSRGDRGQRGPRRRGPRPRVRPGP